jgi:pimeloyl-ACP methyl ester carboxylesterase
MREMSQVGRVVVRGLEIEYEQAGRGERPLVLLHGFTGSRDDWCEQLPRLAVLGRTIAIDQRGHGGSTNTGDPATYTLDELVADLAAALSALGVERCDLLGTSMGGMVALRFALAHPERLASLVLMDTSARAVALFPPAIAQRLASVVRSVGMVGLFQGMRQQAAGDRQRAEPMLRLEREMGSEVYWGRVRAKLEAMDPEAFAALGVAVGEQEALVDRLREITCPTLVIVGEQDAGFLEPAAELERGIPAASRVIVPDAFHSPQQENPDAWLEAVSDHLKRVR